MAAKKTSVPGRKSASSSKSGKASGRGTAGKATRTAPVGRNRLPDVIGILIIALGFLALYFLMADAPESDALGYAMKNIIKGISGALAILVPIIVIFMGCLIVFSGMGKLRPWRVMLAGVIVLLFFGIWHLFAAATISALIPPIYSQFIDASYREGCALARGSGALGGIMSWYAYHYLGVWGGVILMSALLLICVMLLSRVSVREVGEKVSSGLSSGIAEYKSQLEVHGRRKAELRAQKLQERVQREEEQRVANEERMRTIDEERRKREDAECRFEELNRLHAQAEVPMRPRRSNRTLTIENVNDDTAPSTSNMRPRRPPQSTDDGVDMPDFLADGRGSTRRPIQPAHEDSHVGRERALYIEDIHVENAKYRHRGDQEAYKRDMEARSMRDPDAIPPFLDKRRRPGEVYNISDYMQAEQVSDHAPTARLDPAASDLESADISIPPRSQRQSASRAPAEPIRAADELPSPSNAATEMRFDGYYDDLNDAYDLPDDYLPQMPEEREIHYEASASPKPKVSAQTARAIKYTQTDAAEPEIELEHNVEKMLAGNAPGSSYPTGIALDEHGMPYERYSGDAAEPEAAYEDELPFTSPAIEPLAADMEQSASDYADGEDSEADADDVYEAEDELPFVPDIPVRQSMSKSNVSSQFRPVRDQRIGNVPHSRGVDDMPEHTRTSRPMDVGVDHVEIPKLEPVASKVTKEMAMRAAMSPSVSPVPNQPTRGQTGQPAPPPQVPQSQSTQVAQSARPDANAPASLKRKAKLDVPIEEPDDKPYAYPPIDLLTPSTPSKVSSAEQREIDIDKARKLEETLQNFGITAKVIGVSRGPAITRFELSPAPGVRVSKIANLADDIALNLCATTVRIEAPIPGKAAVGVELPNDQIETVALHDVLASDEAVKHKSRLAIALGKDNAGRFVIADIARMPHVLIAGATGSGKSVCINTIIMSILYRSSPAEVRMILIDPKVVELSSYNGVPHLLIPVVTDPKKAASALNWAVLEMTERYQRFAERGVRDMKGYNANLEEDEKPLPSIVVIIDELADLMMVAPGDVEDAICRLAQLARAAGIHLVIATQRPSVNVITGVIKANIPSRIAFTVASQVDSRTILDGAGAEKLLGRGDMLYFPQGVSKPQRVQGAFVSDEEVNLVASYIKSQHEAEYNDALIEHMSSFTDDEVQNDSPEDGHDELTPQVAEIAVEAGQISISMVQRRMRIGYARAGRIVDEMTRLGIVSPSEGAKPRNVLMTREALKQSFSSWY